MTSNGQQLGGLKRATFSTLWSNCYLSSCPELLPEPEDEEASVCRNAEEEAGVRFLDEFAWIAATGVGASYISAVSFGKPVAKGSSALVIRMARNTVIEVAELKAINEFYTKFKVLANSNTSLSEEEKVNKLLLDIICLKRVTLADHVIKVANYIGATNMPIERKDVAQAIARSIPNDLQQSQGNTLTAFIEYLEKNMEDLVQHSKTISSASKLRESANELVRCKRAAQILLSCATAYPDLVQSGVYIRSQVFFKSTFEEDGKQVTDFLDVVRELDPQPAAFWHQLRKASQGRTKELNRNCREALQDGFVHAEMQLLAFYDFNGHSLALSPNYIGVSIPPCYCCRKILDLCSIQTGGSSQKMYHKWRAPGLPTRNPHFENVWAKRLGELARGNIERIQRYITERGNNISDTGSGNCPASVVPDTTSEPNRDSLPVNQIEADVVSETNQQRPMSTSESMASENFSCSNVYSPVNRVEAEVNFGCNPRQSTPPLSHSSSTQQGTGSSGEAPIVEISDFITGTGDAAKPDWELLLGLMAADGDSYLSYNPEEEVIVFPNGFVMRNGRKLATALDYYLNAEELNVHGAIWNKMELKYAPIG